jgi:hypothetical protein
MALLQTFCNHYMRAAPDVNIFNFCYNRTVLDGRHGQIGALGTAGIAFGAVLGPDLAGFGRLYEKGYEKPSLRSGARATAKSARILAD